ncbi:uncharacterized protein [Tenebrio molitor]|uniref:uncharacterized protein isoform X3 n=1 Tax=Tenebrio molitor TaxID=7067 RepID=UPI0036247B29
MGWARKCAVLGCENENSHRHRFPQPDKRRTYGISSADRDCTSRTTAFYFLLHHHKTNDERCLEWLQAIKNKQLQNTALSTVRNCYSVCEDHFETCMFQTVQRVKLNRNARPTLLLPRNGNRQVMEAPLLPPSVPAEPQDQIAPELSAAMEKSQEVSSMLDTDPHAGLFTPPDTVPSTSKGQATVDYKVGGLCVFVLDNIRDNMDMKKMRFCQFQKERCSKRLIKMVSLNNVIFKGRGVVAVEVTAEMILITNSGSLDIFNQHVIKKTEILSYDYEEDDTSVEVIFHPPKPSITLTFVNDAQRDIFLELLRELLDLSRSDSSQDTSTEEPIQEEAH